MNNLQLSGLKQSFQHLIPSCIIKEQILKKDLLIQKYDIPLKVQGQNVGIVTKKDIIVLWVFLENDSFGVLVIKREYPFTRNERTFLDYYRRTIMGLLVETDGQANPLIGRISSWYSFETILVSKYLRRSKNSNFWTPTIIVNQLQSLTLEKYENHSCYSGIIFASDTDEFIKKLNKDIYVFDSFYSDIFIDENFFIRPASFRYVDGRNSFYLINRSQKVLGIVRIKDPKQFSLIERQSNKHLTQFFDVHISSKVWVGYIGFNNEVKVILSKNIFLTWLKSHWHFTDIELLKEILLTNQIDIKIIDPLLSAIITISALRLGTLILLPNDISNLPSIVGKIDDSKLGHQLYAEMRNVSLDYLVANNSVVGMLTSDGITIISKYGEIIDTGSILGLVKNDPEEQIRGGGRTQAAIEASKYGVAIKVSEDGPISIYLNKKEMLKIIV